MGGVCERYPDGEEEGCRWFFGSTTGDSSYTPSSYKCFVADCTMIPDKEGFTHCESEHGKHFYRITDRNAPCQKKKSKEEEQAEIDKLKKEREEEHEKEKTEEGSLSQACPIVFEAPGIGEVFVTPTGWKN